MKTFLFLSLLLALAAVSRGSIATGFFADPKHPGKCVIKPNLILSPGDHQNTRRCGIIHCYSDGSAQFEECGVKTILTPGCTLAEVGDSKTDFPECCQRRVICENNPELHGKIV